MERILPARQPFHFRSVIRSHGWYQLAPLQWNDASGTLRLPLQLASGAVVLVTCAHHDDGLLIAAYDELASYAQDEIAHCVAWMFNLDADYSAFYALADQEPRLAHCRPAGHGRLLRSPSLFEDVVKVMATTNIQWSGTKRLVQRLVEAFGAAHAEAEDVRAFPRAQTIAATDEATLRRLGWGYRAPYLLRLARGVVEGVHDLDGLRQSPLPTPALRNELLKLPGIGPYGAATLLGLLGRHDFIGVDTEAVSAVSKAFYHGRPVGEKEILAVFERWGEYKALAYWFWDWSGVQHASITVWEGQLTGKA